MTDELNQQVVFDREKIKNAIKLQLPIEITTYTLPRNMELYIRKILQIFLEECHQEHMIEYLNFCLGELLTNAKKANTKRVYFKERNLDINSAEDYAKGMENFKQDTLTNIDHYLELQKRDGYYIKLVLQLRGETIKVEIKNNCKLTQNEKERIQNKIDSVGLYSSLEEVMTKVLDTTEGAGLGIIIIILMLQKIGLDKENYQVIPGEEETTTRIILPCNQIMYSGVETLAYEFIALQERCPILKENYEAIQPIVLKDEIDRLELCNAIKTDITLSLLAIKESLKKDPFSIGIRKCLENLSDEEIKFIYSRENSELEFFEADEKRKELWNHAKNTAYFAYNLFLNRPDLQKYATKEEIYTIGLLNGLATIFINSPTKEQEEYMKDLSAQYDLPEEILDVFYSGNGSGYLNLIYAKKIHIPEPFCFTIANWNNLKRKDKLRTELDNVIYMAEIFQYLNEGRIEFYQVDKKKARSFKIESKEQFLYVAGLLNAALGVVGF